MPNSSIGDFRMPTSTRWVLRLDADEYLLPELKDGIAKQNCPTSLLLCRVSLSIADIYLWING